MAASSFPRIIPGRSLGVFFPRSSILPTRMSRGSRVTLPMVETSTPRRIAPEESVPEEIITWEKMYGLVPATPLIVPTRLARANGSETLPSRLVT